ncbi:MAG: phosphoribosylformylglycinamidine synthase, partial [Burkholderiales bacterium]
MAATSAPAFLTLDGTPAASEFRLRQLLDRLPAIDDRVSAVAGRFVYFVWSERALDHDETARLHGLLNDGAPSALDAGTARVFVIPRLGTISPWASKATDIVHNCGMPFVHRVERGVEYAIASRRALLGARALGKTGLERLAACLHDRMTESALLEAPDPSLPFRSLPGKPMRVIPVMRDGRAALDAANCELGLALSDDEVDYLVDAFGALARDPTDVELMMFAQANSEHCRHKIFNASWTVDGEPQPMSLFGMIRHTHAQAPQGTVVAYSDNAAVLEGGPSERFFAGAGGRYAGATEATHYLLKVETHNHPTAISPYPGAATGAGGEIRDEGATGRGARPKFGLTGFTVSNLRIDGFEQPWETAADVNAPLPGRQPAAPYGFPERIASALEIMIDGPIGAASFNNEFGRPNLLGYFRTYEQNVGGQLRGYHKPIMIAGGTGDIQARQVGKQDLPPGALLIQLGGPGMRIGLGGGAASSMGAGSTTAELDFDSVQRGNAEIQRRAQEVLDRCWQRGTGNPILSIHDVGAGGLSNAFPELVDGAGRGAHFVLERIPLEESGMSPAEVWCNEAQARYDVSSAPERRPEFEALCRRERCPYAVVGTVTEQRQLRLASERGAGTATAPAPVDMPLEVLLGKPPKVSRDVRREHCTPKAGDEPAGGLGESLRRVLRFPAVGSKSFLVTIGDRSVGGLVTRDQMVGPWQIPLADAAVTLSGFRSRSGEAMAMGERTPLA